MKTVIEKIISNYFGKFINGIQGNLSVSIFDGNFQLENISLNQQYFDSLNTPFRLTYSSIGKLNLQASLSKLSSTPVECTLDNIYAVFQFRAEDGLSQQLSPQKQLMDKKESIQKYIREMFEEYLKKLRDREEKKQDGMMAKLGKKIIDNLQLKIINLHVRFQENRAGQRYAWGVTLEEISFMTTDSEWKPTFVDRLAEKGKNQKLLKKMNLKNLSVYWQSGLKEKNEPFIGQLKSNPEKANKMLSLIKDTRFSIISLTSEVKLVINQAQEFQLPLYELSVDLDPIVFQLERAQVSQMIDFTQKNISENEQILKNLTLKKKKSKKPFDHGQKQKLQQTFHEFVQNVVDNHELSKQKQKKMEEGNVYEDMAILRTLLNKVDDEELLMWALKPVRKKVKEARERELKKKKKGWFGGEYQLTEEQTRALSNFVQEVTEGTEEQRPASSIFFSLKVQIRGGKFAFINHKGLPEQQILQFQIGKIGLFLVKSQNDSLLDVTTTVQSISLNLFLPIYGTKERQKMNILRNLQHDEEEEEFFDPGEEEEKFIYIKFCKKIQVREEKPTIQTDILGQVKQIAVTYKKVFMKKFKSFFTFNNFNESMKNETIKKWEQIKQKNQQKNPHPEEQNHEVIKMFNINFKITSPLFICPLNQLGGWCINLGQLSVQSYGDGEKEIYPIKVQSAFFRYYPDLNVCFRKMGEAELNANQIFCFVKDMDFMVTYTNYLYIKKEQTDIILPNFEVNFTEKQYKNLLSLKDIFKTDDSQSNFFEILKKEREEIEKKKAYEGAIQKKSEDLDKWHSYFGILSGQFICLYGSEKQLKCLQKVPIKNSRLQYNQQTKIISLVSNEGIIQLTGSEFENNSSVWRDRIAAQLKQFMTIYEVVQEMMSKEEEIQVPRKRQLTGSHVESKREKFMTFRVEKIGFNYKDERNKDVMVFKLYGLVFQDHEQNKISNKAITIQKLDSFDYLHKYSNPSLQTLISTQSLTLKAQKNKNDAQKKLDIQLHFSQIYINWKPDVLVILMKLVYDYLVVKEVKHRVDDGQEKTRDQMFNQVLNDPKFVFARKEYERNGVGRVVQDKRVNFVQKNKRLKELVRLNLTIRKTEVLMIHRQSHLVMFKLTASNIENQVAMGENQKFVAGSIETLMLYQMTGYPRENYTQNDKNTPYLIIQPKPSLSPSSSLSRPHPLVQYKWSSYQPFALPNPSRINSFLSLTINPIQCHYFQQLTFRLIDYILIQIILVLNQPEMVVANENLLEQLKRRGVQGMSQKEVKMRERAVVKVLFSQYQEVVRKIVDPYFMDMYFELRQPSLLLKPQKTSTLYHKADFKNIIFTSQDIKNSSRFSNSECPDVRQYIYEEIYEVICNQCDFYSVAVKEGEGVPEGLLEIVEAEGRVERREELLFEVADIKLVINKLIMQDQINLIYPQLNTYNRSFQTTTLTSPLKIPKLSRHQYLLLNKLINFNMVFDDNKDQHFIHNFKITKLLSPKPIYYELVVPRIEVVGYEGGGVGVKLFQMGMDGFKMVYRRDAELNGCFQIFLMEANLYGYEYHFGGGDRDREKDREKERGMMNLMEEYEQRPTKPKRIDLMQFRAKNKDQYCTDITIKMKTSGQKIIQMNITSIEAFLKLHLMQLIFEWCLLQDWVFPTVSIYANDITFHLTIHQMSAWLKETIEAGLGKDPRAFKFLGVFCYKFHRKANFSQQHLQQMMKTNQITFAQVNKMPQTSYMTILLNTEVFHCLASGNLRTKRQVVEKITFNMIQKSYYKVANQKQFRIKTMTHRKLNLDRGLFKFSFTDIFLMKDVLGQISKDRVYIGQIRDAVNPKKKDPILQSQVSIPADTELSSLQNLDVDIEALSFYLINNCRQTFIPILRLHLNNATINKSNTIKKDLLKANFQISAFYFNANIFRWEPMLEKVDLSMSKLTYAADGEMNVFSSIETVKPVLIDISKEMVTAVRETLEEWNKKDIVSIKSLNDSRKEVQRMKKADSGSSTSSPKKVRSIHETIELVSQYVIRNQIGYPIEIYSHNDRKLLYKIQNLAQVDYEYELQKYDDQNQVQILIGIDILHHRYKFKRITNISLGLDINFSIVPQIAGKNRHETMETLPTKSIINIATETKDSKRYLILKTSKWIEDYLNNRKEITYLPFDHKETIVLKEEPHLGKEVSLFKTTQFRDKGEKDKREKEREKDTKYRYIASDGVLKIMGRAMIYNYTPIPLMVNGFYVLPDQFVTIYSEPTIQNMRYKDCKGVKIQYNQKNQTFYIYCQGYIIDYAGLYFQLEQAKQFSYEFMKNGLKFVIYLLTDTQSKIKVRLQKKFKSTNNIKCSAFIKPAVGNEKFQLRNYSNSLCEYQTYGYLSTYTGNQFKDFKKIIEVAPYYVLSNTTSYKLKICQIESQESFLLEPGERMPFFWQNISKPKQIKIAALKSDTMWGYSGPLTISRNTHSFVVRNTCNIADYRILSLQIENTSTINFVHIVDCHPKKGNNIMLCNHFQAATLRFYQVGIFNKDYEMQNPLEYTFIVRPGEELPFGYEVPLEKHEIQMDIIFDNENPKYAGLNPIQVTLQDIENNLFEKRIDVITNEKRKKCLLLKLNFEGNVKKLQLMHSSKGTNEIKQGQFICKIPAIMISLIGYQDKIRKQIVNVVMSGVQLESAHTNKVTEYVFIIRQFQIENCIKISPIFPVILSSASLGGDRANFFFQFMITKDNFNSKLIHYIGVSIKQFVLSITSEEIQCLQENFRELTQAFTAESRGTSIQDMREYQLFKPTSEDLNESLYFVSAEIHPLKLNLTFKHVNNWGGTLIKTFASIDNCNLSVAGKKISHFNSRNISEFFDHLRKHYEEGISKIIFPMIGNLAILGSPISLAQRIASGFKDLIELPTEGFNNGPLEGGKAIAKGAGSLVKNTFEGAFNSAESVTGSVGNGLSSLAFDEEFSRQRQKIKNDRSSHIGQGLASGAKSIANGFAKGITGVFTSPVEGAQESGIGGFFIGGLKGIAGLVVKPVSGIFDATTKTFEGIKNTPSYLQNQGEKSGKQRRRRNPRVFYTFNRQFRTYDEDLSVSAKIIAQKDQQKYQNLSWYSIYHLQTHQKKQKRNPLLLVTHEYLIVHNLADNTLIQVYKSYDIYDAIYEGPHQARISIYDLKRKKIGYIGFQFRMALANKFVNEVKSICRIYRPIYGFDYKMKDSLEEFLEKEKMEKAEKGEKVEKK